MRAYEILWGNRDWHYRAFVLYVPIAYTWMFTLSPSPLADWLPAIMYLSGLVGWSIGHRYGLARGIEISDRAREYVADQRRAAMRGLQ